MQAYATAFESLDRERVMAFYARDGAMLGHKDGELLSYDATAEQLTGFLRAAQSIAIRYEDVRAHAVTSDVGVIWTRLHEGWVDTTAQSTQFASSSHGSHGGSAVSGGWYTTMAVIRQPRSIPWELAEARSGSRRAARALLPDPGLEQTRPPAIQAFRWRRRPGRSMFVRGRRGPRHFV